MLPNEDVTDFSLINILSFFVYHIDMQNGLWYYLERSLAILSKALNAVRNARHDLMNFLFIFFKKKIKKKIKLQFFFHLHWPLWIIYHFNNFFLKNYSTFCSQSKLIKNLFSSSSRRLVWMQSVLRESSTWTTQERYLGTSRRLLAAAFQRTATWSGLCEDWRIS